MPKHYTDRLKPYRDFHKQMAKLKEKIEKATKHPFEKGLKAEPPKKYNRVPDYKKDDTPQKKLF